MTSVDVVVVGGGTVGGWAACFLREAGRSVALIEVGTLGSGASSRAAGMVRAQGGTEPAIRLGMWSQEFYRGQAEKYGVDSGFVATGYYMPCFSADEVVTAHDRIALQRSLGLDAHWVEPDEVDRGNPAMAPGKTLGASYFAGDGWIDPPRNVLAYATALAACGVRVQERTAFTGLITEGGRVVGVRTAHGELGCSSVVLTGGPTLAAVGAAAGGRRIWSGGTRHQVVVTAAHPDLAPERLPMVFDVHSGIYWRPEEGGLLWGMSNPAEQPGVAVDFDQGYFALMRARMAELVPVTAHLGLRRTWAATIDYTPDHLPILGPLLAADGTEVGGAWVAAAGGHGMMWGPGISRSVADLVLTGTTKVIDVSPLGMDRFDASGRSNLAADPIALPFPQNA